MTRRFAAVAAAFVCALSALVAPAAQAGFTSGQIVAAVNAERSANGIPGDLTENATMTSDCHAHDEYAQQNSGFDSANAHGETKSNATPAGAGFKSDRHPSVLSV